MELIRYKVKGDTVMGVLIDYNWNLGVYYTIECANGFHFFRTRKEAEEYK